MRRSYIAGALLIALASPAFATQGGEGNNTNCNGRGNPNSPCAPSAGGGGQGGAGGAGGAGGRGGTGIGVGVGVGVAHANAAAIAAQRQRQVQAQQQRQRQTATGGQGGNATATGGNVTISGVGDGGYGRDRLQAPSVQAPAIWSNNPCVVAMSGGVSVAGFGASFGGGIEDRDCTRRANAAHLTAIGEGAAAREVMCESREVRAAFQRIGRPCAADAQPVSVSAPVQVAIPVAARVEPALPGYCSIPGIGNPECRR